MTPTSAAIEPAGGSHERDRNGGFTLMEVVLALAIVGMLVTLAVPYVRPGTGAGTLAARANQIAGLMRGDRNMALHLGRDSMVLIDPDSGTVRSILLGRSVRMPEELELRLLPEHASGVTFSADGTSSGARIVLAAQGASVGIDVNRLTAAIRVTEVDR